MNKSIRIFVIGVSAFGLAAVAMAQSAVSPKPQPASQPAATQAKPAPAKPAAAGNQGMIIAIDPVTKEIRPAEASEIQALTGTSNSVLSPRALSFEPMEIQGPGNSVGLMLDPSTMVYMVATKTPDGKLKNDCVTGDKAAEASVRGAQTTTAKKVLDVQ